MNNHQYKYIKVISLHVNLGLSPPFGCVLEKRRDLEDFVAIKEKGDQNRLSERKELIKNGPK